MIPKISVGNILIISIRNYLDDIYYLIIEYGLLISFYIFSSAATVLNLIKISIIKNISGI